MKSVLSGPGDLFSLSSDEFERLAVLMAEEGRPGEPEIDLSGNAGRLMVSKARFTTELAHGPIQTKGPNLSDEQARRSVASKKV
mgnify:CR=1 FL=1